MGSESKRRLDLLLIGPLPPPLGGATRVFSYLVEDLGKDPRIRLQVIDISPGAGRINPTTTLLRLLRTCTRVMRHGLGADVISLHASLKGRIWFGPLLYLITRILRRPLLLRAFGGAFAEQYAGLAAWHRWLLRKTYLRSEICLFQTRSAARFFQDLPARRAEWFSNYTRSLCRPQSERDENRACRDLVFLGHVKKSKGIDVLFDSIPMLAPEIVIDVYGPLYDGYREEEINERGGGRIRYRGVLSESQVVTRLWDYDALVLPTFFPAEGYPGVILEAYAHEMPVIATDWMSIGEIVDSTSGILIEPRDPHAFAEAANALFSDLDLFRRLRRGARAKATQFSDRVWTEQFVKWCFELCNRDGPPAAHEGPERTSA